MRNRFVCSSRILLIVLCNVYKHAYMSMSNRTRMIESYQSMKVAFIYYGLIKFPIPCHIGFLSVFGPSPLRLRAREADICNASITSNA